MKVKNINGTSGNTCKCGSWLNHWMNFSQQSPPPFCPEEWCIGKPELGAHVQKDNSTDTGWYIVPLCSKHNGQIGQSLTIVDKIALVSAHVTRTCGIGK